MIEIRTSSMEGYVGSGAIEKKIILFEGFMENDKVNADIFF